MNYEKDTKNFYKNDEKAADYHAWYTSAGGINGVRFRYIARKEVAAVERLLKQVPHETVIDVPVGTGKMAPLFRKSGSKVLACDVSPNMLKIAEKVYRENGVPSSFQVVALESATQVIKERHDLVVCVRLMHRLPTEVMAQMLSEIARLAPHAIVSFAVDSAYERVRGRVRRNLLSKGSDGVPVYKAWPTHAELVKLLERDFVVVDSTPVANLLSSEVMFLLRSRT